MAVITLNPTSNTTPDPGQGGTAVNSPSNTGHGNTGAVLFQAAGIVIRTCLWTGFSAFSGSPAVVKLRVDFSRLGELIGTGKSNLFSIEYSTNGGSSWQDLHRDTNFDSDSNFVESAAEVTLSNSQDMTQVRVRDQMRADSSTSDVGSVAQINAVVSNIRIEILVPDPSILLSSMM